MAEFIGVEEKAINVGDPLVFENKTDCSYDVSIGVVFHKSGIYKVSIDGNKTTITTVSQKIQDLEQPDIIYKQAALDTIADMQMPIMRSESKTDQLIFKGLGMAWNAIDELDPAQPTYTDAEIQKIQDLEQAQLEKAYQLGYAEGKKDAQLEQRWTPCSEGLPEIDEPVLVTDDSGGMKTVDVDRCGQYEDSEKRFWYYTQNVVAWMPRPKPYRAERTEE